MDPHGSPDLREVSTASARSAIAPKPMATGKQEHKTATEKDLKGSESLKNEKIWKNNEQI